MTKKKDQTITDSSVGIQSERDTNITVHKGASVEVIEAVVKGAVRVAIEHLEGRTVAVEKALERYGAFQDRVYKKLTTTEGVLQEVLENPDFHFALEYGGREFARSGDEQVGEILIDLITARSKEPGRNRLTLSLNDAVTTAAKLTANEFAALSFLFLVQEVRHKKLGNWVQFIEFYRPRMQPIIVDLPEDDTSYRYLVARGCAAQSSLFGNLGEYFSRKYPSLFSKGMDEEQLLKKVDAEQLGNATLFVRCLNDSTRWQLNALNEEMWSEAATKESLTEEQTSWLWSQMKGSLQSSEEVIERICRDIPEMSTAAERWGGTLLKSMRLTTIGVAIGHANAHRLENLEGDLSIWIR